MFRSLRQLFKRALTSSSASRKQSRAKRAPAKARAKFSPRLDVLETRLVPSLLSTFELDGNAQTGVLGAPNGSQTTSHDWDQVFDPVTNGPNGAFGTVFVTDPVNSGNDNIFTSGSSDTGGVHTWTWTTSMPPDKGDIENAYGAVYVDTSVGPTNGHIMLYTGLDRFANNGSNTEGFWFFQSPVTANADGTFSGHHTNGDILLVADFSSAVATITAFEWQGDDNTGMLVSVSPPAGSTGFVNTAEIPVAWPFVDKTNHTSPQAGEFLEVGIDLTALFGVNTPSFTSFLAESRASTSSSAELKDFVLGEIEPNTDLAITKTDGVTSVVAGSSTTYTIVVTNKGPNQALAQQVTDNTPVGVTSDFWTFTGASGGGAITSGSPSSVAGDRSTLVALPSGASVTFSFSANIAPAATGTLVNTATVNVPPGDNTPNDNTATDTDTIVQVADL